MNAQPQDPRAEALERAKAIIKELPAWIWNTTIAPTMFRIHDSTSTLVDKDYNAKEGDLVFQLTNIDGFISIQKIYPPN